MRAKIVHLYVHIQIFLCMRIIIQLILLIVPRHMSNRSASNKHVML